jgi:glycosyltransferase involved in cell wall biosynthesis
MPWTAMSGDEPLVSVVVPSYDRPDRLHDALDSVAEQTYDRIEVVVVDDHSPEPVEQSLTDRRDGYPHELTVVRHDTNRGASAARNTGIERVEGSWIAFLDDDDAWAPDKLARQVDRIRGDDEVGVVYTGMRVVDDDGNTLRTQRATHSGDLTRTLLCRNVVGSFSVVMVRRAAIEDAGTLDERFPSWQDLEWYVRLSKHWTFAAVEEPVVQITQETGHEQISDDFRRIRDESARLFVEKYESLAADQGRLFRRKFRGWLAFRIGAYNALRTGHIDEARSHLLHAVRWYPFEPKFWLYLGVTLGGRPGYNAAKRVKRTLFE